MHPLPREFPLDEYAIFFFQKKLENMLTTIFFYIYIFSQVRNSIKVFLKNHSFMWQLF